MNKKTMSLIAIIILIFVAITATFVVISKQDAQAPSNEAVVSDDVKAEDMAPEKSTNAETEAEAVAVITFTNDGFSPKTISVKKGTVVTVKNESSTNVQFSSDDHPTHTLNTEMNLKTLSPNQSATFTATTVGVHGFHDHIDDSKTGTLTVTE